MCICISHAEVLSDYGKYAIVSYCQVSYDHMRLVSVETLFRV